MVYLWDSVNAFTGALARLFFPSLDIIQMKGEYLPGSGAGSHQAFR
jgi:hypothetical protein